MELNQLEAVAPGLAARIAGAEPGHARIFAFRVARLACALTEVDDATALEVVRGGLERYPEVDELIRLWDLERDLDAACESQLDTAVVAALPRAAGSALPVRRGARRRRRSSLH